MQISVCHSGDVLVVKLRGEFDLQTAPEFCRAMDGVEVESTLCVVVDLAEVTFIDSSGLGALLGCYRDISASGIDFALAAPSHTVQEILGIAGVRRVMDVYPNVESAVRDAEEAQRSDDE